jgi:predicted nucleic acid-binding Zn ribbon protein
LPKSLERSAQRQSIEGWVKLKRQHERGGRRLRRHELEDKHFAPEPEDDFDELRERLLVVVSRAKMPNHYRELLLAKVFDGKSTREFAEERGLNLDSAVMMSTHAVRAVQEFIAGKRSEVLKKKKCVICGKSLGTLGLVCSAVCRGKLRSQKNEKKRQEKLRPCEWCGKIMQFCRSYSRKRFCDRVCSGLNSQSGRTTTKGNRNGNAVKPN